MDTEKFLHIPYDQRWDHLRPTIVRIYMEEKEKIPRLAQRMKNDYDFDAKPHQYRYQFKKWNIKKRITTAEKDDIITVLGKRRADEINTSNVHIDQGGVSKSIDKKQLKRYINDTIRRYEVLEMRSGFFLNRDLPYPALIRSLGGHVHDHPSPFSPQPVTPEYIDVTSPHSGGARPEEREGMSPTMQLVQKKTMLDRAHLLLNDRDVELMAMMTKDERRITATWLHDFWIFSFMTAKYWGRGPKKWTPSLIGFKTFATAVPPPSPGRYGLGDRHQLSTAHSPSEPSLIIDPPSQLCNWSIHEPNLIKYYRIPSPIPEDALDVEDEFDIEDESSWSKWRNLEPDQNLTTAITNGLQNLEFTTIQDDELPLASEAIIASAAKSSDEALVEVIGFAIMSRNYDTLVELVEEEGYPKSIGKIFPFHLAAKFLDGSRACCNIMWGLVDSLEDNNSIAVIYKDNSGMTVLDTLFLSILGSHTTVTPEILGDDFASTSKQTRFPCADIDICGRWDADSPCIRHLRASGEVNIPRSWKHMFCHTSVQAVCHCITTIFLWPWRPNIDTPSGLYRRRCACGLELTVGPLHALVITAYHLAESGLPGENLFGIISCLVCLLTVRADPCLAVDISVEAILTNNSRMEDCRHRRLNAAELVGMVPHVVVDTWSTDIQLGWKTFRAILEYAVSKSQKAVALDDIIYTDGNPDESVKSHCDHKYHRWEDQANQRQIRCHDKQLGMIWAAIQVELLTYRRLGEDDTWLSPYFDMNCVLEGLQNSDGSALQRLIESHGKEGIKEFSRCGLFQDAKDPGCVRREEACSSYYANLEDWKRTTFIAHRRSYY